VTPPQALRLIERALYNQATSSQEAQEEALSVLWDLALLGKDTRDS
jgi:hypothetical protein